jgi:hypothetical protein
MQNFYVIMDYEKSQFAINGVYTPVKEIKEKGYRDPDLYDEDGKKVEGTKSILWAILGSIFGVLVIIGIVALIIFKMRDSRLQSNLAKYETL